MSPHLKTHLYLHALTVVFPYQRARILGLINQICDVKSLISQHSFLPLHMLSSEIAFIWNRLGEPQMRRAGLKSEDIERFFHARKTNDIERDYCELMKHGIRMICIDEDDYPKNLRQIHSPPLCLYALGDLTHLKKSYIAIVGTRMPSVYGTQALQHIVKDMGGYDTGVISGLALGIDRLAHNCAIKMGLPTIAVLGHGHELLTRQSRTEIVRTMTDSQLVISEYPYATPATKFTFPERNRIISGIAKGVIVVEARCASGALITARHAFDQSRDVFAVPGSIFNPCSQGNHDIIKSQIAQIFTTVPEMMEIIGIPQKSFSLQEFFSI